MQGGFAEYFDVAAEQCITIPAGVPFEEAALCEPLAVALHAVTRAAAALRASGIDSGGVSFTGKNISVFGAGPIGLMILLALRQSGADQVTLIDIDDMPLELASRLGAAAVVNSNSGSSVFGGSRESDLAFEASGSPTGLADALRNLRKGGALVQVGNLPAGEVPVPMNLVMSKELTVFGTFRFSEEFAQAVQLVASRAIDVAPLITARVPLAEAARGFELALDRSSNIKVVLTGR
jgi:L-idonate 5-dehydrogenase